MAVRDINEVKPTQKKFRKYHYVLIFFIAVAIVFGTGTCISNYVQAAEYSDMAEDIISEAEEVSEENEELNEILKEENREEFFEKIAREEFNYCRSGEKVFYNSSYGE